MGRLDSLTFRKGEGINRFFYVVLMEAEIAKSDACGSHRESRCLV